MEAPGPNPQRRYKAALCIAIIVILSLGVYSNTFHVPFQWDEDEYIAPNPIVNNISLFFDLSRAKEFGNYYDAVNKRTVGYFTFALNHRIHGSSVEGYHVVNLGIHIINGILVFVFASMTLGIANYGDERKRLLASLATALLFTAHPVQTEAVTYVFQRFASLVTLFYLGAIISYVRWRLTANVWFYILSIISTVLAMKTKENAFTIPFAIALFEMMFLRDRPMKKAYWIPYLLTLFIVPIEVIDLAHPSIAGLGSISQGGQSVQWSDYAITQIRVIAKYLRLLALPTNQNLDYDFPLCCSLTERATLLCLFLLVGVAVAGAWFYGKRRIASFGVFWFFLALSVESSFVPIPMIINEYRLYLPSVGIFLAVSALWFEKSASPFKTATMIVLVMVFGIATFQRNEVWRDELTLWRDVIEKSPLKTRGYNNLGLAYMERGMTANAIDILQRGLELNPYDASLNLNLGNVYFSIKSYPEAEHYYEVGVMSLPEDAKAHNNLGNVYLAEGRLWDAFNEYSVAISLKPWLAEPHSNLALVYLRFGDKAKAKEEIDIAYGIEPEDPTIREIIRRIGN